MPGKSDPHSTPASFDGWAWRIDRIIGWLIEIPAAALVVTETVLLFAGVVARYFLHAPIVWSDELAAILFLWLAMLGATVAFRRGAHMRMTAFIEKAPAKLRTFLDAVAAIAPLLFLILIAQPAYEFAKEERFITTPALEISNVWRAAALPTGFALMLALGLLRLAAITNIKIFLAAISAVMCLVAAFGIGASFLTGLGNANLVVFFVGIVTLCVFASVPIAFSFALATFGYLSLTTSLPSTVLVGRMDEGMSHLILLSVPLFILLGLLIEMTGMAQAMVRFLASLLGGVRGGLSYVLIGAMYLVSGISGAKAADMAAVAPVLFPEMKARGAKPGDLVALLSATGAQTETIPPSLVLITIGSVTGVSIAALFTGGLLPGLVLAVMLCCVVWRRYRQEDLSHVKRQSFRGIARLLVIALPAIALPFIIRAAVMEGVATATEVSSIGIVYALVAGLALYRRFDWSRLYPMLLETASLSGAILLIIGAATAMAWALTQSGFSRALTAAMVGLPGGAATFMAASIVAFVILGSVLEGIPAIVLFGPLLFPVARAVGIHEVHYAMVVILAMGLGLFAPPFGVGYYAACAIGRISPDKGIRPIWGYLFALLIGIILVACIPWISIGFL